MEKNLSEAIISAKIKTLSGWGFEKNSLKKGFQFKDFRSAMAFIVRVSYEAEQQDHHPEIFNCYNKVELSISTHDANNQVTQKDFDLAEAIDSIS